MAEFQVGGNYPTTRTIEMFYSKGLDSGICKVNDPVFEDARSRFWNATNEEEARKAFVDADIWSVKAHTGVYMVHDPGYVAYHPYIKGYSGEIKFWSHQIMRSRMWVDNALKKKIGR